MGECWDSLQVSGCGSMGAGGKASLPALPASGYLLCAWHQNGDHVAFIWKAGRYANQERQDRLGKREEARMG